MLAPPSSAAAAVAVAVFLFVRQKRVRVPKPAIKLNVLPVVQGKQRREHLAAHVAARAAHTTQASISL